MKMATAGALLLFASITAFGQAPAFDAASIKPSGPGAIGSTYGFQRGGIEVHNGTLKGLIEMAYGVRDFQITGGPGWLGSAQYNIVAKGPDEPVPAVRLRVQSLLAERFGLQFHRETREIAEYALTTAKNGTKLAEASAETASSPAGIHMTCGQMTGTHATIAGLAVYLSRLFDRPVVDRTSFTGAYDFQLHWTPDTACADGANTDGPSIFTAVQEQIGLKLETIRGPMEMIVVDRAEKASEN